MEGGGCLSSFIDRRSVESHRYFLARRTVLEMLRDRGYHVAATDIDQTLSDFRSVYGEQPELDRISVSTSLLSDPSYKVIVIFCGPGKFKLATFRSIIEKHRNENFSRIILVLGDQPTTQARVATKEFTCKVETFLVTELLVNITKHFLMPKHEILSEEDKQRLLKKYSVEDNQFLHFIFQLMIKPFETCIICHRTDEFCNVLQFPRMLATDAIARYYGLQPGQIVKITHDTEDTGFHVTYRCVV